MLTLFDPNLCPIYLWSWTGRCLITAASRQHIVCSSGCLSHTAVHREEIFTTWKRSACLWAVWRDIALVSEMLTTAVQKTGMSWFEDCTAVRLPRLTNNTLTDILWCYPLHCPELETAEPELIAEISHNSVHIFTVDDPDWKLWSHCVCVCQLT